MAGPRKQRPQSTTTAPRALDASARAYWLERAEKFATQGQLDRLSEVLDRLWPDADDPDRAAWIVRAAPQHLGALVPAAGEVPEAALTTLAQGVLTWGAGEAERILATTGLPADFVAEARAIREASAALAAGNDAAAAAALKRLPRASIFRDAQRFLRGLAAWYLLDTPGAELALRPLLGHVTYGGAAAALLTRAGLTLDVPAPAPALALLPVTPLSLVTSLAGHLAAKHPNQAVSALAAAFPKLPADLQRCLVRDMPGALIALGVEDLGAIDRLRRALPGLGALVDPVLLEALACEATGYVEDALDAYAELRSGWKRAGRMTDWALVAHRAGRLHLELATAERRPQRCEGCGKFHPVAESTSEHDLESATELFEAALAVTPGDVEIWLDRVKLAEESSGSRDAKDKRRVLEAFVTRFPDHPTALRGAAEAAMERGAFDKAMAFLARAEGVAPLDREVRAMRARALLAKARKKVREDRRDVSRALVDEARGIPHLPHAMVERISAADAVLRALDEPKGTDVDALRRAAVEAGAAYWRWTFRFADEWRLFIRSGGRSGRVPPLPKSVLATAGSPGVPLVAGEGSELCALLRDALDDAPEFKMFLGEILLAAAEISPEAFATFRDFQTLLTSRPTRKCIIDLARPLLDRAPKELGVLHLMYTVMLEAERPAAEFAGAVDRLNALLGDSDALAGFGTDFAKTLASLRDRIAAYVAARIAGKAVKASPSASDPIAVLEARKGKRRRRTVDDTQDDRQIELPLE